MDDVELIITRSSTPAQRHSPQPTSRSEAFYYSDRNESGRKTPPPDYETFLSDNELPSARARARNGLLRQRHTSPTYGTYTSSRVSQIRQTLHIFVCLLLLLLLFLITSAFGIYFVFFLLNITIFIGFSIFIYSFFIIFSCVCRVQIYVRQMLMTILMTKMINKVRELLPAPPYQEDSIMYPATYRRSHCLHHRHLKEEKRRD